MANNIVNIPISMVKWMKVMNLIKMKDNSTSVLEILHDIHKKENEQVVPKRNGDEKLDGYVSARWSSSRNLLSNISAYKQSRNIHAMTDAADSYFKNVFFKRIADEVAELLGIEIKTDPCYLCCSKVESIVIPNYKPYVKFYLKPELAQAVKNMFS